LYREGNTQADSNTKTDIDPLIIHRFARQRTFIRINYFNAKLAEEKRKKKEAKKLARTT
jgi:hypothetical protein